MFVAWAPIHITCRSWVKTAKQEVIVSNGLYSRGNSDCTMFSRVQGIDGDTLSVVLIVYELTSVCL